MARAHERELNFIPCQSADDRVLSPREVHWKYLVHSQYVARVLAAVRAYDYLTQPFPPSSFSSSILHHAHHFPPPSPSPPLLLLSFFHLLPSPARIGHFFCDPSVDVRAVLIGSGFIDRPFAPAPAVKEPGQHGIQFASVRAIHPTPNAVTWRLLNFCNLER